MFLDINEESLKQFVAQCVEAELKKRLPEPPQFLTMTEVKELCGVKKGQTVQALEAKGLIPKRLAGAARPSMFFQMRPRGE
jgi:flagella basal body P-ring formation protein FlgA